MKLDLIRKEFTPHSTIGDFLIDGVWFSFSLEDTVREGIKVPGQTAIPYGTYQVTKNYSNRFKCVMPLLLNVPKCEGIRIHSLNTAEQTEGCIGIGYKKSEEYIYQSRKALKDFMPKLEAGLVQGMVTITIVKG
jgi:hypothetical protein